MEKFIIFCICLIITCALVGCGGSSNNTTSTSNTTQQKQETTKEYSNIDISEIKYQDGKVKVNGSTDLPNNSKITISFDVAGRSAKDTYIGVDEEVSVQNSKFSAELVPPDRNEFTSGKYVVEVLFTPMAQSQDIINLVGKSGENLTGGNAQKNDMLKINTLEVNKQVELQLNAKTTTYPVIDINSYNSNTPERTLAEYLNCWKEKNWDNMANYTQITWKSSAKNPNEELKSQYDFKELLGAEIKDKKVNSSVSVDVTAVVYYRIRNDVVTKTITARIIRETSKNTLSEDGQWGINPVSAMREQ
ncbi:hypothetical protein [Clostridium magnum]|uniref:hypothetical protein n=1 Tax=Clostridium magnum TaxID=33954 RepID=UPI00091CB778|nr:hypothetical protein [Clostridium magnum]SHJ28614.1 hypothetical protein SAMN02745944_05687 [Clostridium magnum DSM 2767]